MRRPCKPPRPAHSPALRAQIGGSYNGMVACWDMRAGETPTSASKIEKSHRDPVYSIAYLQSKTGTDCASVSTDGRVLFWDTRNLAEPYEEMELMPKSFAGGQDCLLGGCSLEYSAGGGPTKFMVRVFEPGGVSASATVR